MRASVSFLVEKKNGGPPHAMALFMYSDLATLPLISVTFLTEIIEYIRELKQQRFWATHVNRK